MSTKVPFVKVICGWVGRPGGKTYGQGGAERVKGGRVLFAKGGQGAGLANIVSRIYQSSGSNIDKESL